MLDEFERARLKLRRERDDPETGSYLPRFEGGILIGLRQNGLGMHSLHEAFLPDLCVGQRTWEHVFVFTADHLKLSDIANDGAFPPEIHGVLGLDFLTDHRAVIDFSSAIIWFPPEPKSSR